MPALEATQGHMDGFFSQLPYKCHLKEVASVGDRLKICPWVTSRVVTQIKRLTQNGERGRQRRAGTTLEATQGQFDGFFSQLPYKCHQNRVASAGD